MPYTTFDNISRPQPKGKIWSPTVNNFPTEYPRRVRSKIGKF